MPAKHTNRLVHETSPYLLQHAHNPVDWYPWGEEALCLAREQDRPILLSIGYSSCHWCHVMERESFEDAATARLMNENFVCVKVDREERPDLDELYMAATVAFSSHGGWPMTVFLDPDQRPFFAGTYFPPRDGHDKPGFPSLLKKLAELWRERRDDLVEQGRKLQQRLVAETRPSGAARLGTALLEEVAGHFAERFDRRYGGFGEAPKFPPSSGLSLLLRHYDRTGDEESLEMVCATLDGMARGGLYDQIGGGFARYSTDERWLVPHFEKMLCDNALLTGVYLEAHQATGSGLYRRIAGEVLDYVMAEMTSPEGGFYSATDADSEGEEGKFFVWTPEQVEEDLGKTEGERLCAYYDITPEGNWEGKSIPHVPRSLEQVAQALKLTPEALGESLRAGRRKLYEVRRKRVPPGLDDKIITAWNGMMIAALAEGARVLGESRYLSAALRAADFLRDRLTDGQGRLGRTFRQGQARGCGFLEDYACFAGSLIDLYEAGAPVSCLEQALSLGERILEQFRDDEHGGLFDTARDHEELLVRPRSSQDGAMPAPNAVAASVLVRLSWHYDREEFRELAREALEVHGRAIRRAPWGFARSLAVLDMLERGPVQLYLAGDSEELRRALAERYVPNRVLAHGEEDPSRPLTVGKREPGGTPALYVCRNFVCTRPITRPEELEQAFQEAGRASRLQGRASRETTAGPGRVELGKGGPWVSRLGFGGYRISEDHEDHRDALRDALKGPINLIDTSTNYTDGSSERLVGQVLQELARDEGLARQQVVLVSKIGYVQGRNLQLATQRKEEGRPFPEIVEYSDDCWHCVHPEFLEDQLRRSLARLRLESLDVCLLHNPEYFLSDARKRGKLPLEDARAEFYRRLELGFGFLESQVAAGRIGCYGVSSNTCVSPPEEFEATSLERMLEAAARAAGGGHHFRVIQLPMNLYEPGALLEGVLRQAEESGIAVLVNRPLNAFTEEGMIRLADFEVGSDADDFPAALQELARLEKEFSREFEAEMPGSSGAFAWAEQLRELPDHLQNHEHWRQLEEYRVRPMLVRNLQAIGQALPEPRQPIWQTWKKRYLPVFQATMNALDELATARSRDRSLEVKRSIDPLLPESHRDETLSRKALWILTSTPGVTSVLCGMRTPEYVADAMGVLDWPRLERAAEVYRRLASE